MRALLDTNIVIHRENNIVSNQGIGLLFYWLDKLNYTKCIHPFVVEELRSYKNTELQELYDVKLASYEELKTIALQSEDFKSKLPDIKSNNDRIDNQLLCEVYSKRVDLLITEDKALRRKAQSLNIANKVLSINQFVSLCTAENPELINYKMLAVKKEYMERLLSEFEGSRIEGNKIIIEDGKYEIVIDNTDLDIGVQEHSEGLLLSITDVQRKNTEQDGKKYASTIWFNVEANMTEGEYVATKGEEPEDKEKMILDAWNESWGEQATSIDELVTIELNINYGKEHADISGWQSDQDLLAECGREEEFVPPVPGL